MRGIGRRRGQTNTRGNDDISHVVTQGGGIFSQSQRPKAGESGSDEVATSEMGEGTKMGWPKSGIREEMGDAGLAEEGKEIGSREGEDAGRRG